MLNSNTPLAGTHEQLSVSFSPISSYYVITWITNKNIGYGDVYARYYPGGSQQATDVVYLEQLDPSGTWANISDVACNENEADCLVTWTLIKDSAYFTFGRQINLVSNTITGHLISHETGFMDPLDNLGTQASWGTSTPHVSVAAGSKNYSLGFTGLGPSAIKGALARMTDFTPQPGWTSASAGSDHIIGTRSENLLWSLGENYYGQLGLGDKKHRASPIQVKSPQPWYAVTAGGYHSLGILPDGTLWSWGTGVFGQLGVNLPAAEAVIPTQVSPGTKWTAVTGGTDHTLAISSDGSLYGWGNNTAFQLGVRDQNPRITPAQVGNFNDWSAIAAGMNHSLGIRSDGSLWAWGNNTYSQLGMATTTQTEPTQVGTSNDWKAISAGHDHSLGIRSDGSLCVWGRNSEKQLGLGGNLLHRLEPEKVGLAYNWVTVTGGIYHSLGIRSDGTLWTWGQNTDGQLGLGDTNDRNQPTRVGSANDWIAVSAGDNFSVGIRSDGSLWRWGGLSKEGINTKIQVPTKIEMNFPWNLFLPTILNNRSKK